MELPKRGRIRIIMFSSGEFATTQHNAEHHRTSHSHHQQRNTTQHTALLALPGNDKHRQFNTQCHSPSRPVLGRLFL